MPVLTVTQFNRVVNEVLDPLDVHVEGEISQWQIWQNKYIYGCIKDENSIAQIFASVFEVRNAGIFKVGMKVKLKGKPTIHAKSGKFSINAYEITPEGDGSIAQAFDILKQKLETEGLFDKSRKRKIPTYPTKIGLITAKDSQAYNDFTKIMNERWCGYTIYFYPAQVQGKDSVASIVEAINFFNEKFEEELDVLVVARGGGSMEDLISFNDEQVVRSVYASKFPVVSGVGHEGDITLIDYVSDLRASTPSNAAELISPDKKDLEKRLENYSSLLNKDVKMIVENMERDLADISIDFERNINKTIDSYNDELISYERILKSYDYKNTLKRGYAIIRDNKEKIIKNFAAGSKLSSIKVEFDDGTFDARVIQKDSPDDIITMF